MIDFKRWLLAGAAATALLGGMVTAAPADASTVPAQLAPATLQPAAAQMGAAATRPGVVVKPDTTAGYYYVCANGGKGLCLQNNYLLGSLIANDNQIPGSSCSPPCHQGWTLYSEGVTSASYPFNTSALNHDVAAGRGVWKLQSDAPGENYCLAEESLQPKLEQCNNDPAFHTLWVASGSGRLISVSGSDQQATLAFLQSNGLNGGNPVFVANPTTCPSACWFPF